MWPRRSRWATTHPSWTPTTPRSAPRPASTTTGTRAAIRPGSQRRTTGSRHASTPSWAAAGWRTTCARWCSRRRPSRAPAVSRTCTTSSPRIWWPSRWKRVRWHGCRWPARAGCPALDGGSRCLAPLDKFVYYGAVARPSRVLRPDLSQLRPSRGHRLQLRRRGEPATEGGALSARAGRIQLLPRQRRRGPARVVVPPLRLRRVVPRGARHAHQPGASDGASVVTRLPERDGQRIERERELGFTFDGKPVAGLEGDTIGSALFAAGRRTFSRSFKYHRPRGLMCCAGQCPNCLVQVDGAPGVRACTEPLREGVKVEHMNASPSLEFDVMRATDKFGGPFTPPGFYYKTFIRPRRLWPLYEKVLRHAAGLGRIAKSQPEREWRTEYRRRHADVLVVGGGAAGLHAAIAAAEQGADVVLADEGPEPGGRLLAEGGHAHARELTARAEEAGVEVLTSAPALGTFDGLVPVWQGDTLHQVRAKRQIHATGAIEQPLLFPGNDLPGVMLSGGARRLISMYALQPGTRAVVATVDDRGLHAALALIDAGVELACVADLRNNGGTPGLNALMRRGVRPLRGMTVLEARGRDQVQGVVLGTPGSGEGEGEHAFGCDLLVVSGGSAPATSLLTQAGGRTGYDRQFGQFVLEQLPDEVYAAGEVAGAGRLPDAERSGATAGAAAARALGFRDGDRSGAGQARPLAHGDRSGAGQARPLAHGDRSGAGQARPLAHGDRSGVGQARPLAHGDRSGVGQARPLAHGDEVVAGHGDGHGGTVARPPEVAVPPAITSRRQGK